MDTVNLKPGICHNGKGENISPITSTKTVYKDSKNLDEILNNKIGSEPFNEEGIIISVESESIEEVLNNIKDNTTNIKNSLGNTSDSDGSNTSGSINAKLNNIIENESNIKETLNNYIVENGEIENKIDSVINLINTLSDEDINDIKTKIGNISDEDTDTIFSKLNKLVSCFTNERLTKIDNIGEFSNSDNVSNLLYDIKKKNDDIYKRSTLNNLYTYISTDSVKTVDFEDMGTIVSGSTYGSFDLFVADDYMFLFHKFGVVSGSTYKSLLYLSCYNINDKTAIYENKKIGEHSSTGYLKEFGSGTSLSKKHDSIYKYYDKSNNKIYFYLTDSKNKKMFLYSLSDIFTDPSIESITITNVTKTYMNIFSFNGERYILEYSDKLIYKIKNGLSGEVSENNIITEPFNIDFDDGYSIYSFLGIDDKYIYLAIKKNQIDIVKYDYISNSGKPELLIKTNFISSKYLNNFFYYQNKNIIIEKTGTINIRGGDDPTYKPGLFYILDRDGYDNIYIIDDKVFTVSPISYSGSYGGLEGLMFTDKYILFMTSYDFNGYSVTIDKYILNYNQY